MPHVTVTHFPHDFTDQEKQQLADDITDVITRHYAIYPGAVSIALHPVAETDWNTAVLPEIKESDHLLIQAPRYRTTQEDT